MQFQCRPMQDNTLQSQSLASHNIALQNRCFAPLHQAPLNCALAFLCTAFPFLALLFHSFAIQSVTLRCFASAMHCFTPPCRCFSGRIEATHFDAQPSRATASQYFAFTMLNISQQLRCSTTPGSTFPLRCRDTHRPAKPLLFFWFQNRTQPILCSS